jgi:hypothetical protein
MMRRRRRRRNGSLLTLVELELLVERVERRRFVTFYEGVCR